MEYVKDQNKTVEMPDGKTSSMTPIGGIVASTSTPLANNAEWTSGWFDISAYGSISVSHNSDRSMLLYFDYSADGANVLQGTPAGSYTNLGNNDVYIFPTVKAKYFRFKVKNNSGQTQNNLSVIIRAFTEVTPSAHTVSLSVFPQQVAMVTKSIPEAPDESGIFAKILRVVDALKVYVTNFPTSFAVNNFPNPQNVSVNNFPSNQTVTTSNLLNPHPVSVSNLQNPMPVNGTVGINNFPSSQTISGTVSIGNPISIYDPPRFSAVAKFGTIVSLPQDIITISGSASKLIKIRRIILSANATLTALTDILLIRRPSLPTGGSPQNVTAAPFDTNNSASATIKQFTVNPISAAGTLIHQQRLLAIAASALIKPDTTIEFTQGIALRGASDILAINLNGVTIAGFALIATIEWTEE